MSSFTDHTAITPSSTTRGLWDNDVSYSFYTDLLGKRITIIVPKGYSFDGASVPGLLLYIIGFILWYFGIDLFLVVFFIAAMVQKVQYDTIAGSGVHDRIYTHERRIGRINADVIYIESLIVYNIPKLLDDKKYLLAFIKTIQYSLMGAVLILGSRWTRYKLTLKIIEFRNTGRIK